MRLRPFHVRDAAALAEIWRDPAIRARNDVPEPAGRQALKEIDWAHRRAVAAVWVAPRFRGRRIAARALRLAAAHAFAHGLACVDAECETDNDASLRSLIAAGMRYEGSRDLHMLGMLPEDLANAPAFRSDWPSENDCEGEDRRAEEHACDPAQHE